jgi:hypothetical protein
MRPQEITQTGTGTTAWIPVNYRQSPFNIGFGAVIVSGTATYTVQHTFDDIYNSTVTPVAFDNANATAQTANKDSNYMFPIRAMRLNVTAGAAPVVKLTILQGTNA